MGGRVGTVLGYALGGGLMRVFGAMHGVLLAGFVLFAEGMLPSQARAGQNSQPAGGAKSEPGEEAAVLVGAGDIVWCQDPRGAAATAKLIEKIPGTVFAAGDLVYDAGTPRQFQACYDGTWGKFKDRTRPALGNHEYGERHAIPYFLYWGDRAGANGKGYYSYDL